MILVEAFQAPCCGGPAGQLNELRMAALMRTVQQKLADRVKITIHTLVFGDPASLEAVHQLGDYLRASGLGPVADNGVFGILGTLPIITVNGTVRFVKMVSSEADMLKALQDLESAQTTR